MFCWLRGVEVGTAVRLLSLGIARSPRRRTLQPRGEANRTNGRRRSASSTPGALSTESTPPNHRPLAIPLNPRLPTESITLSASRRGRSPPRRRARPTPRFPCSRASTPPPPPGRAGRVVSHHGPSESAARLPAGDTGRVERPLRCHYPTTSFARRRALREREFPGPRAQGPYEAPCLSRLSGQSAELVQVCCARVPWRNVAFTVRFIRVG